MRKTITLSLALCGALVVFAGCSQKQEVAFSKDKTVAAISTYTPSQFKAYGPAERTTLSATMQVAAEQTLATGNRYFAIVKPDQVSNTKGSMMNTMKEFIDKCYPSVFGTVFTLGKCGMSNMSTGNMVIVMAKTPSDKVMMYDANEVIGELKKQDFYDQSRQNVDIVSTDKGDTK